MTLLICGKPSSILHQNRKKSVFDVKSLENSRNIHLTFKLKTDATIRTELGTPEHRTKTEIEGIYGASDAIVFCTVATELSICLCLNYRCAYFMLYGRSTFVYTDDALT